MNTVLKYSYGNLKIALYFRVIFLENRKMIFRSIYYFLLLLKTTPYLLFLSLVLVVQFVCPFINLSMLICNHSACAILTRPQQILETGLGLVEQEFTFSNIVLNVIYYDRGRKYEAIGTLL